MTTPADEDRPLFPAEAPKTRPTGRRRVMDEKDEVPAIRYTASAPVPTPQAEKPKATKKPKKDQPADDMTGLVAGPVVITKATIAADASPGMTAAAIAAGLALIAAAARFLAGDRGPALLIGGVILPLALVAAVAVIRHRAAGDRSGRHVDRRFTLRTSGGRNVVLTLRDDEPRDALSAGDLIRVTPGKRGTARRVDVLAGLDGPVIRRLSARPAIAAAQWMGFAAAAVSLAVAAVLIMGGF